MRIDPTWHADQRSAWITLVIAVRALYQLLRREPHGPTCEAPLR